jgi:hypothetical protein
MTVNDGVGQEQHRLLNPTQDRAQLAAAAAVQLLGFFHCGEPCSWRASVEDLNAQELGHQLRGVDRRNAHTQRRRIGRLE